MTRFVADASMAIAWAHTDQATDGSSEALKKVESGCIVVVPSLWFTEVANGLVILVRRKRMKEERRLAALAELEKFTLEIDGEGTRQAFKAVSDLALKHGLSVYDATYLELAKRLKLPLASQDNALRAAAQTVGITLIPNVTEN